MLPWDSLFLTKNGHDRYAVLDMEEYRQYEKLMAKQKLITELEKVAAPGRSRGASLRRMWKRNWESMTKVKMPMAGEITCPACLVKSYAMTTMRKRIPGQLKNALSARRKILCKRYSTKPKISHDQCAYLGLIPLGHRFPGRPGRYARRRRE
ncbi:hypothetical protein MR478_08850, partial [bacterium]|nr:hypothetical protein [bacterium]